MVASVPAAVDYDGLPNLRQILVPQYTVLPADRIRAMQALTALNLGPKRRNTIQVGSPVPAAGISKIIGRLASQASAEGTEWSPGGQMLCPPVALDAGSLITAI
jgi:hypothetical protein